MTATTATLQDRIRALDDFGRKTVLHYLAGYAPEAMETALDEIAAQQAEVRDDLANWQLPGHQCSAACAEAGG